MAGWLLANRRLCLLNSDGNDPLTRRRCHRGSHRASGSGRSWNFTTFGRVPLPVSVWNGVRVP